VLPPVDQVSEMTTPQQVQKPHRVPPIAVSPAADHDGFERPGYLKTIAELADPMQSDIVKGWLQSDMRTPN
jgi:hypothetical protein